MKVLFVTRGFPLADDPMAGNYEAVQAKAIAGKGHEVAVISIHWHNMLHIMENRKIHYRVVNGIDIYECNGLTASIPHIYFSKFENKFREWQLKRVFNRYLKDHGMPDVVHGHIILSAAPAVFLKREYHIPFIITEHWSRAFERKAIKRVLNMMSVYRQADRLICVSEALSRELYEKVGVESIVINNMVDNVFFETGKVKKTNDTSFKFISVGALREGKRFELLVDAFADCNFPENVSLLIVGEGSNRPAIEREIEKRKMNKQIILLGLKKPDEVNGLLSQCDCFVLSSRLETFSIVLIEAMAKGLPVISTRCGGPETFVRPQDGLLVEKENVKEFSSQLYSR